MKLPGIVSRCPSPARQTTGIQLPSLLVTPKVGCQARPFGRKDFEDVGFLGEGGFGAVKLVKYSRDDQLYAMKAVEKAALHDRRHAGDENAGQRAQVERDVGVAARQWKCPFIVELFATFQTSEKLYYVFEYCPRGTLSTLLEHQPHGRFQEKDARFYAAEICLALEHLHQNGVIHRDVRLENILLAADGHAKLSDFGIAKVVPAAPLRSAAAAAAAGGPRPSWRFADGLGQAYYPPEFGQGEAYGVDVDCWQLGVALFTMLAGELPLPGDTGPGQLPKTSSRAASTLCAALLDRERSERLGYHRGAAELRGHDFFASIDWRRLEEKSIEPPQLEPEHAEEVGRRGRRSRHARPSIDSRTALVDFIKLPKFGFRSSRFKRSSVKEAWGETWTV